MTPQYVWHQGRRYLRFGQFDPRGQGTYMKALARRNNVDPAMLARRQAGRRRKTPVPAALP
jgi:hypothetical protein